MQPARPGRSPRRRLRAGTGRAGSCSRRRSGRRAGAGRRPRLAGPSTSVCAFSDSAASSRWYPGGFEGVIQRWNAATASTAARATRTAGRSTIDLTRAIVERRSEAGCHGTLPGVRILVTGGGGFLGSHLVERLEREGHDVVVARRADHDLTSMDADGPAVRGGGGRARLPPRRRGRRHRREPREPRALLVREPRDGDERPRAGADPRDAEARDRRAPSARTRSTRRSPSRRTTSGTGTRRRRTRPTASRRRRCSWGRRRTASSTAWTRSSSSPRTCTDRATTSTSRPRT